MTMMLDAQASPAPAVNQTSDDTMLAVQSQNEIYLRAIAWGIARLLDLSLEELIDDSVETPTTSAVD